MTDGERIRVLHLDIWRLLNPTRTEKIHVRLDRGLGTNASIVLSGNCTSLVRQQINVKAQAIREILYLYPNTCEIASVKVTWSATLLHPPSNQTATPQWPPGTPPPIFNPPLPPTVPIAEGTCWAIA